MTVTKDVVRDLMPLYLAGEASADTRRLVEEFLRANPGELPPSGILSLPAANPPASAEMDSLNRTRNLYSRRTSAFAGALGVSYAVFSFRFDSAGLSFILFRDLPSAAWTLLAIAAGIWIHFFLIHRQWVATGLAGAAPAKSALWLFGGALAVLPYAFVASYQFGLDDVRALCVAGAFLGLAIGHALHRNQRPR